MELAMQPAKDIFSGNTYPEVFYPLCSYNDLLQEATGLVEFIMRKMNRVYYFGMTCDSTHVINMAQLTMDSMRWQMHLAFSILREIIKEEIKEIDVRKKHHNSLSSIREDVRGQYGMFMEKTQGEVK